MCENRQQTQPHLKQQLRTPLMLLTFRHLGKTFQNKCRILRQIHVYKVLFCLDRRESNCGDEPDVHTVCSR